MLRSNNKISFASLSTKMGISGSTNNEPIRESRVSKLTKLSMSKGGCSVRQVDDRCKVVKLIGDKQSNIEEIMSGISCVCGCKGEFKNILNLLMTKIYRLREERNFYKREMEGINREEMRQNEADVVTVGVNTDGTQVMDPAEQLRKLIEDSKSGFDHSVRFFRTDELDDVIPLNRLTSITFQEEANETNLLEDGPGWQNSPAEYSKLSFEQEPGSEYRALREYDSNADPASLTHLRSYFKQNCLNLNKLECYIQKLKCARELDRYEIDKRNKALF